MVLRRRREPAVPQHPEASLTHRRPRLTVPAAGAPPPPSVRKAEPPTTTTTPVPNLQAGCQGRWAHGCLGPGTGQLGLAWAARRAQGATRRQRVQRATRRQQWGAGNAQAGARSGRRAGRRVQWAACWQQQADGSVQRGAAAGSVPVAARSVQCSAEAPCERQRRHGTRSRPDTARSGSPCLALRPGGTLCRQLSSGPASGRGPAGRRHAGGHCQRQPRPVSRWVPVGTHSTRPSISPSKDWGQLPRQQTPAPGQAPVPGPEPNATESWHGHLGARLTLTPSAPACRACAPLPALCPLPELRAEATLPVLPRLLRSPPAQGRGDAVRTLSPLARQGEHRGVAMPCQSHCHVPAHTPSGDREGPSGTCPPYLQRVSAAPRSPPWEPARPIRPATARGGTGSCRPRGTLGGRAERAAIRHAWLRVLGFASVWHGAK